ncbi:TIGR04372 family glycosyltransferase [bacterium]|nr:TIGR04372 family glycosyltransferase [bacterium]
MIKLNDELLKQAQDYCDVGNWDEAIAYCYQAIRSQPHFAIAYLALGNVLTSQERVELAIRAYSKAIEFDPCLVDAHIKRGDLYFKQGNLDEATACYQRAIALDPNLGTAHLNLSKILHQKGMLNEAIACQQKAIEVRPDLVDAETCLNLGDDLFWRGHKDRGIAYYRWAVALKPDWLEAWKHLSHQLYNAGRFVESRETFQVFLRRQHELAKVHQLDRLGIRLLTQEWTLYIGHMALLDYYVKMGLLGLRPPVNSILIMLQNKVVNPTYLQYWHQYLSVVSNPSLIQQLSPWTRYLEDYVSMTMLSDGRVEDYLTNWVATQRQWDGENRSPLLSLSPSDTERGWKCLRDLGVSETEWFVAVHVRESGYKRENPNAYVSARNADIDTYLLAFQSIVERGGWVIRMGDSTMKPLPQMERIIDYGHSSLKSDWMDVFLWAKCRFFIGTASGPCSVPPTFGVPCVLTNFHLCPLPFNEDIFYS